MYVKATGVELTLQGDTVAVAETLNRNIQTLVKRFTRMEERLARLEEAAGI